MFAGLVLLTAVLGGCGDDGSEEPAAAPEVAFAAQGQTSRTGPAQFCDVEVTDCEADPEAVAVLRVPPGTRVLATVPDSVREAPWQVVFRYRLAGETTNGRSTVFAPGTTSEFAFTAPANAQLETMEVQQYGVPADGADGRDFVIRATWVLSVDDR